jgi:hypothetical protein
MCQHRLTNLLRSIDALQRPCAPTIVTGADSARLSVDRCTNDSQIVAPLFPWLASGGILNITSALRALLAQLRIASDTECQLLKPAFLLDLFRADALRSEARYQVGNKRN